MLKTCCMVFALVGMFGCEPTQIAVVQNGRPMAVYASNYAEYGYYMQDRRTHLCFLSYGTGNSLVLTNVPCTSEVMELMEPMMVPDAQRRQ